MKWTFIITDVIMPGINGPTMIETVIPKFPAREGDIHLRLC